MSKIGSMLGIATKAGQLISGTAGVEAAIKKQKVKLVICATDLSPKTIKNFQYLCQRYPVEFHTLATVSELGLWIGRPGRGVIGIISDDFSKVICSLLKDGGEEP